MEEERLSRQIDAANVPGRRQVHWTANANYVPPKPPGTDKARCFPARMLWIIGWLTAASHLP